MAIEIDTSEEGNLGSGHFGTVYKAFDSDLQRTVAVKFFNRTDDRFIEDIRKDIAPLLGTTHQNVLSIFQIAELQRPGKESDELSLVMEYVNGITLRKHFETVNIDLMTAKQLGKQLVDGLGAMHSAGSYHGDLHKNNIMIADGVLKIIDPYAAIGPTFFSTASREECMQNDVWHAADIISELFRVATDGKSTLKAPVLFSSGLISVEDLRERLALFESANQDSPIVNLVDEYVQYFSNAGLSAKNRMISKSISSQTEAISSWMSYNEPITISEKNAVKINQSLFSSNENAFAVIAAGQMQSGEWNGHLRILKRLAFTDFRQTSSLSSVIDLPSGLAYSYLRLSGAVALLSGHQNRYLELLTMKFRSRYSELYTAYTSKALSGWPTSFGGNCVVAWKGLLEMFHESVLLREIFGSYEMYCASLYTFSVLTGFGGYLKQKESGVDVREGDFGFSILPPSLFYKNTDNILFEFIELVDRIDSWDLIFGELVFAKKDSAVNCKAEWDNFVHHYVVHMNGMGMGSFDLPSLATVNPFN